MKRYRTALLVLAGVMCVTLLASTVFAADNFTGTWKLNAQKSECSPGTPPKSLTSTGDTASFTFDGYDSTGKAIVPDELSIKLDGKDYSIADDPTRDTNKPASQLRFGKRKNALDRNPSNRYRFRRSVM